MHVLLIGNFAPDHQESMLRFDRQLSAGLRERQHEVSLWRPQPRLVRLLPRYRYDGFAKYVGYLDKFLLFPRRVRARLARQPVDLVHIIDHANAVYAPLFASRPTLVTCHDLMQVRAARGEFAQHRVTGLGRRYQEWILAHIARLRHVATPSAQTGRDLQRLAGLPPQRITVIPMGLNHPYRRTEPAEAWPVVARLLRARGLAAEMPSLEQRGFILNVGGGQWYKNRRGLLEIYAALTRTLVPAPRLLLVGKPLAAEHRTLLQSLGLDSHVLHVSQLSELQLQALYSTAEALLFPSWHEGFGWPVAEAQACGCPVFTSDRAPMTEVGGDAAVYFDPGDAHGAARTIATGWARRLELRQKGLARAPEWAPARMIDRYLETYQHLGARPEAVAA